MPEASRGLSAERRGQRPDTLSLYLEAHLPVPSPRRFGTRGVRVPNHARVHWRGRGPHRQPSPRRRGAANRKSCRPRPGSGAQRPSGSRPPYPAALHPREAGSARATALTHEAAIPRNLSRVPGRADATVVVSGLADMTLPGRQSGPRGGGVLAPVPEKSETPSAGRPLLRHGLSHDRGHRQGRGRTRGKPSSPVSGSLALLFFADFGRRVTTMP